MFQFDDFYDGKYFNLTNFLTENISIFRFFFFSKNELKLKIDLIGQCIFKSWTCDGDKDCPSGADEANCTSSEETESPIFPAPFFPNATQCNEWTFRCNNGQCIPYWWKCDGTEDCSDKSDELECQDEKEVNIV